MTDKTLKYVIPKLNKTTTQISTTVTNDFAVIGVDRFIEEGPDNSYIYANVSSLAYTYDGINYIESNSGDILNGVNKVDFNGYQWMACGYNDTETESILLSSDGINWTTPVTNVLPSYVLDVVWGGKKWVAVGQVNPESSINRIAYSSDGMNWTLSTYNSNNHVGLFNCLAYNGSYFLAGGLNSIAKSTDGINWTDVDVTSTLSYVKSLTWNGSIWVGTGYNAYPIAHSTDGVSWTAYTGTLINYANTVVYNGTIFLVGGGGVYKLISSKDGINWSGVILYENQSISNGINDMTWTGTQWIVIGNVNPGETIPKIACSSDLVTWTPSNNGDALYNDILYVNSITSRNRRNYFLTYT